MNRLGRETHVTYYGNAGLNDSGDRFLHFDATFEFHRFGKSLLNQSSGGFEGFFRRNSVRHERHVGADVSATNAPGHGAGVIDHVIECHGNRAFVTLHHHAQRIAHQHHVHASVVYQPSEGGVIGRDNRDFPVVGFHGTD